MKINPQVVNRLQELSIDRDAGLLVLLGLYYELDIDKACIEEAVKAVNLTGIVEKDYGDGGRASDKLKWNFPLFIGEGEIQEEIGDWRWISKWMQPFGKLNPDRAGTYEDVLKRMQKFFGEHPGFTVEEVFKARDLYLSSVTSPTYVMKSHKFIYEGIGKMQTSNLLQYCRLLKTKEKEVSTGQDNIGIGKVMTRKKGGV
jgi:hypothetical protein